MKEGCRALRECTEGVSHSAGAPEAVACLCCSVGTIFGIYRVKEGSTGTVEDVLRVRLTEISNIFIFQ